MAWEVGVGDADVILRDAASMVKVRTWPGGSLEVTPDCSD